MVTVGDMREIAESILEQLEGLDDERKIHTRCNDYTDIQMEDEE